LSDAERILGEVKGFLLEQFLPEEDPAALTNDIALVTSGVLDSVALVKLVAHLEETYGVELEAYEISADFLDTPAMIAGTVEGKLSERAG